MQRASERRRWSRHRWVWIMISGGLVTLTALVWSGAGRWSSPDPARPLTWLDAPPRTSATPPSLPIAASSDPPSFSPERSAVSAPSMTPAAAAANAVPGNNDAATATTADADPHRFAASPGSGEPAVRPSGARASSETAAWREQTDPAVTRPIWHALSCAAGSAPQDDPELRAAARMLWQVYAQTGQLPDGARVPALEGRRAGVTALLPPSLAAAGDSGPCVVDGIDLTLFPLDRAMRIGWVVIEHVSDPSVRWLVFVAE